MTTYALYILVTFLLNNFHDELHTPFEVFERFFEYFSEFDWSGKIVTIYGPIPAQSPSSKRNGSNFEALALEERANDPVLKHKELLVKPNQLKERQVKYDQVRKLLSESSSVLKSSKDWNQTWSKPIKIADPCVSHNNLGRSMSLQNYNRFKEALKLQRKDLKRLKETFLNESGASSPSRFF